MWRPGLLRREGQPPSARQLEVPGNALRPTGVPAHSTDGPQATGYPSHGTHVIPQDCETSHVSVAEDVETRPTLADCSRGPAHRFAGSEETRRRPRETGTGVGPVTPV